MSQPSRNFQLSGENKTARTKKIGKKQQENHLRHYKSGKLNIIKSQD